MDTYLGYYYQKAPNISESNKWVTYLAGGGEYDTQSACEYQLTSALGSSKYFANESNPSGWYFGSDYCPYNPMLCGWNHVMDPYCTQDLHSGQITKPTDETWGLYFSGRHVLLATLDALDATANLKSATDIVVSGASAGGIGVWMNVDYIAERYPHARVTAVTIAGHYFYANYYTGENHTNPGGMGDFQESAMPNTYALYDAFVDESCKQAYEVRGESPGACLLSNNSIPYIKSDAFIAQSQTDKYVVIISSICFHQVI